MIDEKPNLEGRLDASVGDLILLSNPIEEKETLDYIKELGSKSVRDLILLSNPTKEKEASGYIKELRYKSVTLSHENPAKPVGWSVNGRSFFGFSRGDRTYRLQGFTDYEVLRKANQE